MLRIVESPKLILRTIFLENILMKLRGVLWANLLNLSHNLLAEKENWSEICWEALWEVPV
jgi:hypothetical protein